jgi:hypothetical protein
MNLSNLSAIWLAAAATVGILLAYEIALLVVQWRNPQSLARAVHVRLREEWFAALSQHAGSEILAVQTLRNSMMSATMTASTAALGLMAAATLAAPSLSTTLGTAVDAPAVSFTARLALELMLMVVLFASLVCSAMSVRYYNHAGFICTMPIHSNERQYWASTGVVYLRRAGLLYSWGLRYLLMVAPLLASMVYPFAGPVSALLVVIVLVGFDRFSLPK